MRVHVCVCSHACVCVHVCAHMHVYMCTRAFVCLRLCVCMCAFFFTDKAARFIFNRCLFKKDPYRTTERLLVFVFLNLRCKLFHLGKRCFETHVKSAKAFEVLNETLESQEARYKNKDDYLRARKLDKRADAKKERRRGLPLVNDLSIEFLTIPNQNIES